MGPCYLIGLFAVLAAFGRSDVKGGGSARLPFVTALRHDVPVALDYPHLDYTLWRITLKPSSTGTGANGLAVRAGAPGSRVRQLVQPDEPPRAFT
jgi:hypothetical protein